MMINNVVTWKRYNGYECSSQGDKRFSAFFAFLPDGNSIEYHYQCNVKGYRSIREGKGKPPLRSVNNLWQEYLNLWTIWAKNHPELMDALLTLCKEYNYVLSDKFATTKNNQAAALAWLLNNPKLWRS